MLLGAMREVTVWDDWVDLFDGDEVVFYTDGLERPNEPVEDTVQRILEGSAGRDPDQLVEDIIAARKGSNERGTDDDIAVIVVQVERSPQDQQDT
jgi:serine phosphatase RsbU (regulator of sigma subunit)